MSSATTHVFENDYDNTVETPNFFPPGAAASAERAPGVTRPVSVVATHSSLSPDTSTVTTGTGDFVTTFCDVLPSMFFS